MVEEEADESAYWMEMIIEAELIKSSLVKPLLAEANEIVAIITSSRISAAKKPIKNLKSKITRCKSLPKSVFAVRSSRP